MEEEQKPKPYLAIKNWERYQMRDRKNRGIRAYIKDYCGKDIDDPEYNGLTMLQRYLWDACCRVRGRSGRNLRNDVKWLSTACGVLPVERRFVGQAIAKLVLCGFLVPTNEELSSSESKTDTKTKSETETNSSTGGSDDLDEPVASGGGFAPSPDPALPKTPESAAPEPVTAESRPYVALAKKLFTEIGSPARYENPETAKAWTLLLKNESGNRTVQYLDTIMTWALADSFWFPKIRKSRKIDPCEYFISKLLTFEEQMEGEEKDRSKQKSNGKTAAGAANADGAPEYRKEKLW